MFSGGRERVHWERMGWGEGRLIFCCTSSIDPSFQQIKIIILISIYVALFFCHLTLIIEHFFHHFYFPIWSFLRVTIKWMKNENLVIALTRNHCFVKKHPLTTNIWHQTNTVIHIGCKMNLLSTICISDQDFVEFRKNL